MKLNHERFRKFCRTVSLTEIAKALGVSQQAVSQRLRNLENIRLREFLTICEVIDEPIETFLETDNDAEYRSSTDDRMPSRV